MENMVEHFLLFPFCRMNQRGHCRLFDISKQVVGQLFVHVSNLLVSDITSGHTSGNACVAYFLNILIDTTFGKPGPPTPSALAFRS